MLPLMEERDNKTIYLFTSDPCSTFKYLVDNEKYVINWDYFSGVEEYYNDYIKLEKEINEKRNRKLFYMFCNLHNVAIGDFLKKEDEIIKIINKSNFDEQYLIDCDNLGVKALDKSKIAVFNKNKELLKRNAESNLIKRSLWGKILKNLF